MARQLSGADRPWFIRVKRGRNCDLRPYSRAGWLITFLYATAVIGGSLLLVGRDDPGALILIAWGVLMVAVTSAFLLIAWRTSESRTASGSGTKSRASDRTRTLALALLSAAAIIGAALLGVKL